MIIIRNIILSELIEVLNSFPKGTKMVRIEYTEHNSKMVVYASEEEKEDSTEDPHISPEEDLSDYIDDL